MNTKNFKKYWDILKRNYQDKTHNEEDFKIYYSILKDYNDEQIIAAIKEVLKYQKYFPRVDEIIQYIPEEINTYENILKNKISYDKDGTMLWDGKRCEITPPTEEERKEMEEILNGICNIH